MPVYATDIILKTAIEAGIADLRANKWILEECLSGLAMDSISRTEYGWKEVVAATKWFDGNDIKVIENYRMNLDSPRFPCITVTHMSSTENMSRVMNADDGSDTEINPRNITGSGLYAKNPVRITPQFTPVNYDAVTGYMTLPDNVTTVNLAEGQALVSSKTGSGYEIFSISGLNEINIGSEVVEDFTDCYVAPRFTLWNLHSGVSFIDEDFQIGIHVQSDPIQARWLSQIIWYVLFRVKEAFLEGRGFELTTMNMGPISIEEGLPGDRVFTRNINFRGTMPITFIKYAAPKLEKVVGGIDLVGVPATPAAYVEQALAQGWKPDSDSK
jgi:hypothetical protein